MTLINSTKQPYKVLTLTFKGDKDGIIDCELWNDGYSWDYAIGVKSCPPIHAKFVGMAKIDFNAWSKENEADIEDLDRRTKESHLLESTL